MSLNRLQTALLAVLLISMGTASARRYSPWYLLVAKRVLHAQPVSLSAVVATGLTVCGIAALVGYLSSESEAQKNARLERERQRLAMIAAMTPEQREIYYQEERLKLEQQKAQAMKDQANAAWWSSTFAVANALAYEPHYVIEEVVIY